MNDLDHFRLRRAFAWLGRMMIAELYRAGTFDGPHVDPSRDPNSEAGRRNVAECAAMIERGAL